MTVEEYKLEALNILDKVESDIKVLETRLYEAKNMIVYAKRIKDIKEICDFYFNFDNKNTKGDNVWK